MIISITGTPGTGKTLVAEHLNHPTLDLTKFVKQRKLGEQAEEFEVDIAEMKKALKEEVKNYENLSIEGHLSHHFPANYCVVLRCKPEELEKRLKKREYSDSKIKENVESEKLDIILSEAVNIQQKIIEIDTTDREPEEVALEIEERIEKDDTGYGKIDWLSDYEL